jgi:hypothetical protein
MNPVDSETPWFLTISPDSKQVTTISDFRHGLCKLPSQERKFEENFIESHTSITKQGK